MFSIVIQIYFKKIIYFFVLKYKYIKIIFLF